MQNNAETASPTVLVTGAAGFIATHCVYLLLEAGHRVRGSVRRREQSAFLEDLFGAEANLETVQLDLLSDAGWDQAMHGCDYVLHVASPLPAGRPADENDLIRPAREGTLRVLAAAEKAGVKRVVVTSSTAAVSGGSAGDRELTEADWTQIGETTSPYQKSKTLAERAAWEFMQGLEGESSMEMVTINPSLVIGPVFGGERKNTSNEMINRLMTRQTPGSADLYFNTVDVRDVAEAHVTAMTHPDAAGKRFIACAELHSMHDFAVLLDAHFGKRGYKVPTRKLPDVAVKLVGLFDPLARNLVPQLGLKQRISNQRLCTLFGWTPRPFEDMVIDATESMITHGWF
jgi:dihydroflavonol-4-reductase